MLQSRIFLNNVICEGWEAIDASTGATIPVKQGKFSVEGASAALMPTCTQGESIYVEQFI
jgi:hypothetical protein